MAKRIHAGGPGLDRVHPRSGLVAYTTCPELGALARVEIIGRAPEHDFDQHQAWRWLWLTGPRKGETTAAYGRSFWRHRRARHGLK